MTFKPGCAFRAQVIDEQEPKGPGTHPVHPSTQRTSTDTTSCTRLKPRLAAGVDIFALSARIARSEPRYTQEGDVFSAKGITAIVLCVLLLDLPVLAGPQTAGQHAGQIDALIPAATRNDVIAKTKDDVDWNDLLKTAKSGRVRADLIDGSILSVGSNSQLRVVEHDAASQQTSLEINYGKLRSQVEKITKPGGKFEVKTPNAVIGAIGTDFYVAYLKNKTTIICYKGAVSVTPIGNVQILRNSGQTNSATNSITVNEGQMVVVSDVLPPPSDAPPSVQQSTLLATDIPLKPPVEYQAGQVGGHVFTWTLVGVAVAAGAALTAVAITGGHGIPKAPANTPPPTGPGCPVGVAAC